MASGGVVSIAAPRMWRIAIHGAPPLLFFCAAIAGWKATSTAWLVMLEVALAIYFSLKWITWCQAAAGVRPPLGRSLGYLLLWPGMDAMQFLDVRVAVARPAARAWLGALGNTLIGALLICKMVPITWQVSAPAAGWVGLAGIILVLHFGLFGLMALAWQAAGVCAEPIMRAPLRAHGVADFWARWNTAFRDAGAQLVYRPLLRHTSPKRAMVAVFILSGILHELVISLPAEGGYGLPMAYFLFQAVALSVERTRVGRRWGLGRGVFGRLFALAVVTLPIVALFPPQFASRVLLPLIDALGAFRGVLQCSI